MSKSILVKSLQAAPAALRSKRRGFSMMEVLVSMIIFSFALVGVIGLQLASVRSNQFSGSAAVATSLVRDYTEMMQANPSIGLTGGTSTYANLDSGATLTAPNECKGTSVSCTPDQFASFQAYEWMLRVKAALPSGRVVVCHDTAFRKTDGTYQWACNNTGEIMVVKVGWAAKFNNTGTQFETSLNDNTAPKMVIVVTGNQKGQTL